MAPMVMSTMFAPSRVPAIAIAALRVEVADFALVSPLVTRVLTVVVVTHSCVWTTVNAISVLDVASDGGDDDEGGDENLEKLDHATLLNFSR